MYRRGDARLLSRKSPSRCRFPALCQRMPRRTKRPVECARPDCEHDRVAEHAAHGRRADAVAQRGLPGVAQGGGGSRRRRENIKMLGRCADVRRAWRACCPRGLIYEISQMRSWGLTDFRVRLRFRPLIRSIADSGEYRGGNDPMHWLDRQHVDAPKRVVYVNHRGDGNQDFGCPGQQGAMNGQHDSQVFVFVSEERCKRLANPSFH